MVNGADGHPRRADAGTPCRARRIGPPRFAGVALSGPDWSLYDEHPEFDFSDPAVARTMHTTILLPPTPDGACVGRPRARARDPFFLSEFGSWAGGEPFTNPTTTSPASYANQLIDAEKVIDGLNAGGTGSIGGVSRIAGTWMARGSWCVRSIRKNGIT